VPSQLPTWAVCLAQPEMSSPQFFLQERFASGCNTKKSLCCKVMSRSGFEIAGTCCTLLGCAGPTQPPIQWVPGALSLEVKRPVRGAIPPLPNTPSWRNAQLKHRDNFTFLPLLPTSPV
jgi:hypothetical protein